MTVDEKLLDAVYEKLKRGEPHTIQEIDRFVNFLAMANFNNISSPSEQDIAALNAKIVNMMQQKFMGKS